MELGTPADRVTVLRNGVDLELFQPRRSRAGARANSDSSAARWAAWAR